MTTDAAPGQAPKTAAPKKPRQPRKAAAQKAGPPSALKTGSPRPDVAPVTHRLRYSVQIHTDEHGLQVKEPIDAESGDEAAAKALAEFNYRGASVRGVQPYSDPDANSLGGERDAAQMIANAENQGDAMRDLMGTQANREASEKLGKADISELGQ